MYELYKINNDVNNRVFLGRSGQPDQFENHLKLLNKGQHYNNLLQKDFNNGVTYDYEVLKKSDSPTDIAVSAIERINDGNLLNPLYGYNTFFDKEGLNSRTAKLSLFDEDIITFFLLHNKDKILTLKKFNINNNVFKYRLKRNGVLTGQKILISSYKALYIYAMQIVALSPKPLTAAQIQCELFNRFDVSKRLMTNAHKISKNLRKCGIHSVRINNFLYYEVQ